MILNEQQLNGIEEYAALFFSPTEIAIIIQVDTFDFCQMVKDNSTLAHKHFYKGLLTSTAELRKVSKQFAMKGSHSNLENMEKHLQKLLINL